MLAIVAGVALFQDSSCTTGNPGPCLPAADTVGSIVVQSSVTATVAPGLEEDGRSDGVDDALGACLMVLMAVLFVFTRLRSFGAALTRAVPAHRALPRTVSSRVSSLEQLCVRRT
ncbi:hypothetical protein GCM10022380_87470 [Amycolatopsis tucumanensis]|uniref:Uncharacterized protein n=1 Tax=Amycolatopsis tucumanensis TaxID=401106 RepID=A0ABP7JXY0_9PSEU